MKTIFNPNHRAEIIKRIQSLDKDASAQWGKMSCYKMMVHCRMSEEMFQGITTYPRLFIGRLFGPMALKSILKDDAFLKPNSPTHPLLKITGDGDIEVERKKWITLIENYQDFSINQFIHPFFGKMNKEDMGIYLYKHNDHHLRQFGL